jgi:hypothetical protein
VADSQQQTSLSTHGTVMVQQRPTLALMKLTLRAADATTERSLASLKKQCESTAQWLKRLGASRVDIGEPHFADQAAKDPMAVAAARMTARRGGAAKGDEQKKEVRVVMLARWEIAALTGEETLLLVDRLRFESADTSKAAAAEEDETPAWESPEEQIGNMIAQMSQLPAENTEPVILFITRLRQERLGEAFAGAMSIARASAERLAQATGMRLGGLRSVHTNVGGMVTSRTDKIMERQRCGMLLAGCSYPLGEDEIVSDGPCSEEFTVTAHATFNLE